MPASFLFKNRLFIERDSKHRKVVSNFGLIFRNSKWGNYENTNVTVDFKNIYFKLILIFLIFSFFFFFFYESNNFFFSSISFFFWFTVDSFDYYLSFIIWSFFSFISISMSKLFFFINKQNLSDNCSSLKNSKKINKTPFNISSTNLQISQNDLNWIMHSWLISKTNEDFYLKKCTEFFFDSNVSKKFWDKNYMFYLHLYKAVFFLNLNNNNFYNYKNYCHNYKNWSTTFTFTFFNNTLLFKEYFAIIYNYYYKLNSTNKIIDSNRSSTLAYNFKWTIDKSTIEGSKINIPTYFKKGHFFFNEYSLYNLLQSLQNSELFFFKNLILQQSIDSNITFSKWNRWLYRYSLLHRKSIKFANKLTFSKKLMNSGFYNSSIFKKNLWNSNFFTTKKLNSAQMTTFFDLYFNEFITSQKTDFATQKQQTSFIFNDRANFLIFKFFENSYFWKLKRLFLFNSLKSNFSFFKLNLKNESVKINKNFPPYFLFINLFGKNRNFFLSNLSVIDTDFIKEDESLFIAQNLFGVIDENDLFSKENLVTLDLLSLNSNYYFFSELKPLVFIDYKKLNFNFFFAWKLQELNKFFHNFFINDIINSANNNYFLKDLFILTTFLK